MTKTVLFALAFLGFSTCASLDISNFSAPIVQECGVVRAELPMRMIVNSAEEGWKAAIFQGLATWNREKKAFIVTFRAEFEPMQRGDIMIIVDPDQKGSAYTKFFTDQNCHIFAAIIVLPERIPESQRDRIITHEMGHTLGLNHNPNPDDLMFPISFPTAWKISPAEWDLAMSSPDRALTP